MLVLADMLPTLVVLSMLPSVRLMLSMDIVDTLLLVMGMGMDLAMPGMDMESVMLMPSQRLKLSMDIGDTLLLVMGMVMDLAMPGMDMESVMLMLSQRLMLSMEPMLDMVTDLDIVHTPSDTVMDMVMDMDTVTDMDTMVKIFGNTNKELKTEFTFLSLLP